MPRMFVAANRFIPEGVESAAVFPDHSTCIQDDRINRFPDVFHRSSHGIRIRDIPDHDLKDPFPRALLKLFLAAAALARFLQNRITLFVSCFNANCRAVSFPSPAFAPVIKTLSIMSFSFFGSWLLAEVEQSSARSYTEPTSAKGSRLGGARPNSVCEITNYLVVY